MGSILDSLSRQVMGNRRRHRRRRRKYDTIIRDETGREVFRGWTTDISQSGARLSGFPASKGVFPGQSVMVEFLLIPKEVDKIAQRAPIPSHIRRVVEKEDEYIVAVMFDQTLS